MTVEAKRKLEALRGDVTDPKFYFDRAFQEAEERILKAEAEGKFSFEFPSSHIHLAYFLTPIVIEEKSADWKEEARRLSPITSWQVSELLRAKGMKEAIDESKVLAKEKLQRHFQDTCIVGGIVPESEKAQEAFEALTKLANQLREKVPVEAF